MVTAIDGTEATFADHLVDAKLAVEDLTDELALPPYVILDEGERARLVADLEPISAKLQAAGSR